MPLKSLDVALKCATKSQKSKIKDFANQTSHVKKLIFFTLAYYDWHLMVDFFVDQGVDLNERFKNILKFEKDMLLKKVFNNNGYASK